MDRKNLNLATKYLERPFEIKVLNEDGSFAGYGSVFGNVDQQNEVVAPGAFSRSLASWKKKKAMPPVLWQHDRDQPVGIYTEMSEDDTGLAVQGNLALKVQRAAEAYELMKMKAVSGLSIGYRVVKEEEDRESGITTLKEVDLWEVSLVTFPANDKARIRTVKSILDAGELPTERESRGSCGMPDSLGLRQRPCWLTAIRPFLCGMLTKRPYRICCRISWKP